MSALLKKVIIALAVIAIAFIVPVKQQIYRAYQNIGLKVGINFNNIATNEYRNWIENQPGSIVPDLQAVFLNNNIKASDQLADISLVLGENTGPDDSKWIEVDLSEQKLYMKENGNTIKSFLVSSGKWAPTLTGEWRIWTKMRYARMTGGSKALHTFYDLPNVPYTMYYNQGYGIHGAYWHNNFGHPMSHGCINMKPEEAGIVFNWASVGTKVIVHD